MKQDPDPIAAPALDAAGILHDFAALAANVTDAYTVALFLVDDSGKNLKLAACHTLSDHIPAGLSVPVDSCMVGLHFSRGTRFHEPYFEGDPMELGIYSQPEEIRAYMTAPVGGRGLLWMDTKKAYRFTPKSLKLLTDLAANCRHMVELTELRMREANRARCDNLIQELLPSWSDLTGLSNQGLDLAVEKILQMGGFDGVLTAVRDADRGLLEITACAGFSHWVRKGRLVRQSPGWVSWAIEHRSTVLIPQVRQDDDHAIVFHAGERFGFEVKSLAVIPWQSRDGEAALVLAGRDENPLLKENQSFWQLVGQVVGFLYSAACTERVMSRVRRYDGESGLISEGYFREVSRRTFDRAREKGTGLLLFLTQLKDIDRLYLENDHSVVNRFLEAFSDRLSLAARGRGERGKYRTGGFGLLVEGVDAQEAATIAATAESILRSGPLEIDGTPFHCEIDAAYAHYPSECRDHTGLWRQVLSTIDAEKVKE